MTYIQGLLIFIKIALLRYFGDLQTFPLFVIIYKQYKKGRKYEEE